MSTATKALAMAVLVQAFLSSSAWAQNENWMSELKADRESLERLLEHTGVKELSKRIDAVYEPSGYTWINAAWAVMLMKEGIIPEKDVPQVANALQDFWNSKAAKGHTDARAFQGYFNNKLGAPVAGEYDDRTRSSVGEDGDAGAASPPQADESHLRVCSKSCSIRRISTRRL